MLMHQEKRVGNWKRTSCDGKSFRLDSGLEGLASFFSGAAVTFLCVCHFI
jgi:hypothetical protein